MKKMLFLVLLVVSSAGLVISQTPCVSDYKINNGGGQCTDVNETPSTGTVTLSFDGPIDPLNIPTIISVTDITDPLDPQIMKEIDFGSGTLLNNGDVKYCYYVGPNNNNNLQGQQSQYRFFISYSGTPCGEQGALPVSFRAFTAVRANSVVALKWTTSTESNNLGFEIQRLIGAGKWQTLSFIATQAQGGNSSSDLNYTHADLNPTKGVSQYRIRQVDIDGRSKLSEIRAVRGDGQKGKTIVYPNPSSDGKVSIIFEDVNGIRDVSVTDISGRMIRQMKGVTINNIVVDNLATGIYTVRIINNETGEQEVQKFVVNKR